MKQLIKQVNHVLDISDFYKRKLKGHLKIKTINDFVFLPFTTKSELLQDQENNPPFGSNLCIPKQNIQRIHKTSGTTNKPLLIALTENDISNTVEVGAKCFSISGLKSTDIVIHCLNYNMWAGGYTDHQSLEKTGAAVIPFGVGNSKKLIETILQIKPTAIHCTPSYLSKLELIMDQEFGLKPQSLNLKLGLFGAESGLQNDDFRENIEKNWGLKAMNANYGMSAVLSMFGAECRFQDGLHFIGYNVIYPELIDYHTGNLLQIENGVVGELVLTNLYKEAQPLIRYRTNDIIKILAINKCECGEKSFRFEVIGRSDDMIVIKGVNVFISAIDKIINNHLEKITSVYKILIKRNEPVDRILIKLEMRNNIINNKENFVNKIISDFKEKIGIKPEIKLVKEKSLPRVEEKTKKVYKTL